SRSQDIVRVSSTALCCASGESETTRSKEVSSSSWKLLARCRLMSMPISSITATAKGSSSPARTPTESTKTRRLCRSLNRPSAIGERKAFSVQQKRTLPGRSAIRSPHSTPDMEDTDEGEETACSIAVDLNLTDQPLAQ